MISAWQRRNVQLFLHYWASIPDENIAPKLGYWRRNGRTICKTIACAGGWVPYMPPFRKLIVADYDGAPMMRSGGGCDGAAAVAYTLFGNGNLFEFRRSAEQGTDKEVATRRFEALLQGNQR